MKTARVTRRDAIKRVALGVGAAVSLPAVSNAAWAQALAIRQQAAAEASSGLRFFTVAEHRLVDRLTEMIIPADDQSPGASAAKVADFIDYLLSGSDEESQRVWREGLSGLDRQAQSRWRQPFIDSTADQQQELLTDVAARESSPRSRLELFFVQLKERTVQAYYTSEIGIHQELRYKGNTYLDEFVGCTHPEHS